MKYLLTLFGLLILSPISTFSQSTLIKNINVINVESGKIETKKNILIEGEKISKVSSKQIQVAQNTTTIDGSDKFIMPGMVDTHIHFFQTGSLYTRPDAIDMRHVFSYEDEIQFAKDIIPDNFKRYLRLGITSVMDVGGPFYNFKVRDSIAKNNISPNVYLTGPLFSPYQPEAFSKLEDIPIEKITSKEEATVLFNKMIAYKPDFIKIWYIASNDIPAEKTFPIVEHIAQLTHKNNLKLTVHATQLNTAKLAIKAGADILVHSVTDTTVDKEFVKLLKDNNVTYIPTLIVSRNYGKAFLANPSNHHQDLTFANPAVYKTLTDINKFSDDEIPERILNLRKDGQWLEDRYILSDSISSVNLKKLSKEGVNIATGTDAGNIGTMHASSYIQEIETMKKMGMSNIDIIKASTINAAKGFGLDTKIGSITEGKLADLVILNKNPIEDLQNLNTINEVIKSGKVLDIHKLIEETPEQIVQRQVNAYNARNIDAFMDTYADNIEIFNFPNEPSISGKDQMKSRFQSMFESVPNLYCEIKNRIVLGNKVVDREYVRFGERYSSVIAIYEITDGKISKVTFLR
ncbi:amidohydrolase family protein [Aquimarina sp. 2201CG14-23]|uniref:amidohydrolase family protein n=1 Tax=Aquimarina mycalae TaxID=3040073 RepID=UPI0024780CC9|nr:amidohydrolase family protein [Aquimarina sp. 2201CG14-23]MDH7447184.1 amidohydrolase family protein [Aquimarina sp. 2201CG14-23]